MKKLSIVFFCLLMIFLLVACDEKYIQFDTDETENQSQEQPPEQTQEQAQEQTQAPTPDQSQDQTQETTPDQPQDNENTPVMIERGKHFSLSRSNDENGNYTYFIEIYDKAGNVVLSRKNDYISAYEWEVSEEETVVSIYCYGMYQFYSSPENRLSPFFSEVLEQNGRLVAYTIEERDSKRLVVQDIFDTSKFYRVYDHEAVKNGRPDANFSQDGKSITLKYRLESAKKDTTKVLCLEVLPILKTQKICYVRYEPGINSECVMVSSGVRAVLRADTGDTIRLLGSLTGGEYTSDDGTVRNDWYCIDYRGKICYVTADSFSTDHQIDIPFEENVPYFFISDQERTSWKDKIINVISANNLYEDYEILQHNFLGMGLIDLNLDGMPELIAAYAGGSMGNVCLIPYDLNTGERLCSLGFGETPHYWNYDNVYLCVRRNSEGKYIVLNKGFLRYGLEGYYIISALNEDLEFDVLFEEVSENSIAKAYYINGVGVSKTEYEKQLALFEEEYQEISVTHMQLVYWHSIDTSDWSKAVSMMADALINSTQEFIDFDIDYKQAYLEFLKDKQESYRSFSLVYIDGDDIPELYLKGVSEAEGDMVCSFKNGKVVCQQLGRTGGGSYIPKGGKIINQNGHMGMYYDNVYKLDGNGFSELLNAHYTETYEHIGNEEYITHRKYFISGSEVSEAEYNAAINSAFELQGAIRLDENAVSYEEIVRQLGGDYGGK